MPGQQWHFSGLAPVSPSYPQRSVALGATGDGGGDDGGIEGAYVRQKHCLLRVPICGSGSVVPKGSSVSRSRKPFSYQHLPLPEGLYPTVRPVAIIISTVVASIHCDESVVESSLVYRGP